MLACWPDHYDGAGRNLARNRLDVPGVGIAARFRARGVSVVAIGASWPCGSDWRIRPVRGARAWSPSITLLLGWVFSRSANMGTALGILRQIGSLRYSFSNATPVFVLVLAAAAIAHYVPQDWYNRGIIQFARTPALVQAGAMALLALAIRYVAATGASPFIYSKFLKSNMRAFETIPRKTAVTILALAAMALPQAIRSARLSFRSSTAPALTPTAGELPSTSPRPATASGGTQDAGAPTSYLHGAAGQSG